MHFPEKFYTAHFAFVNYILLSEKDSAIIWRTRNNPLISKWMDNSTLIPWEDHCNFIHSLPERDDRVYYAVYYEGKLIGAMYVNPIQDKTGESGEFILPEFHGLGFGRMMKVEFIGYVLENDLLYEITERVKLNNIRNQRLNESIGFEMLKKDDQYYYFSINRNKVYGINSQTI